MTPATQILLFGKPFRITDFFRMGQIGWHWQIDDPLKRVGIPYEWTDTAGTTPVTAVGQGIGLLLGREYGGATGPSLLANGATGLTGTATAASYNTSTFAGSVSRAGDASNQSWVTWTGLTTSAVHRIRITNTGATSLDVRNGGVAGTIVASIAAGASSWVHPATTGGSTSITITATSNSTTATFTLGQFAVLPGTHLTQATGTAQPTLSAMVNLLTYTEQFDNAYWAKTASSVTANADGNADKIVENGTTAAHLIATASQSLTAGAVYVFRVRAKAAGRSVIQLVPSGSTFSGPVHANFDLSNGTVSASGGAVSTSISAAGNGYYDCELRATCTSSASSGPLNIVVQNSPTAARAATYAGDGTSGILVAWADLRTADDAAKNIPAYQRVGATATDHDTDGFPHYAEGDGTDNCWASVATVDGRGSDKVTVVAAVTKNSDAASAVLLELTSSIATNNGAFALFPPGAAAANTLFRSKGTVQADATATGLAAPVTYVAAGVADIGADSVSLAINGVVAATAATDQGTGNYSNATLHVLSRSGASLRFNGRFYGSTGRFGPMGDSERNNLTRWWQKRIGTA